MIDLYRFNPDSPQKKTPSHCRH